ncbi:uncharacterized protein BJ212DRAFT_1486892 [Suillus subaureus]|uniref:Uncharacterized protein n=1 Tax=Suillus subaureus TaxID=48587 RepID=A0A9P7DVA8_9AGAM|nr:uncharacterized protein BJ212DRAFT_1486892 [Suillus subaureus]KAG1804053.1 hypothetical protein BJ212DRAFT_1486892 [Suillus subaureus]
MSSEPDLDGYDVDTSICVSDGQSDIPHMTPSDDLLLDPASAFWNPERVSLLRAQLLMPLVSVEIVEAVLILATIPDPESLTPLASVKMVPVLATIPDPKSVTELESKPKVCTALPPVVTTPKPKKDWTDFFATPSPPSPMSNYWKYVTPEEDALWYDRAGTDDGFQVVHQMKQELCEIK